MSAENQSSPRRHGDTEKDILTSGADDPRIHELALEVAGEVRRAISLWPEMANAHEAYSVILEELDEYWDHVKTNQKRRDLAEMRKELIQVAAMAIRAIYDTLPESSAS